MRFGVEEVIGKETWRQPISTMSMSDKVFFGSSVMWQCLQNIYIYITIYVYMHMYIYIYAYMYINKYLEARKYKYIYY